MKRNNGHSDPYNSFSSECTSFIRTPDTANEFRESFGVGVNEVLLYTETMLVWHPNNS